MKQCQMPTYIPDETTFFSIDPECDPNELYTRLYLQACKIYRYFSYYNAMDTYTHLNVT